MKDSFETRMARLKVKKSAPNYGIDRYPTPRQFGYERGILRQCEIDMSVMKMADKPLDLGYLKFKPFAEAAPKMIKVDTGGHEESRRDLELELQQARDRELIFLLLFMSAIIGLIFWVSL